ncbi:MAG: M1 family metallopeptidase, partial [Acidobacteriota bacterium]|nr:M1 family metallopeptidase [Acidobacteriota bacterium]
YLTDSTKGTMPIYQEIPNLSAAKSAYGNIVYRKAPSFLRQAEFYLGEDKFQTAVRAFSKKHQFKNAEWQDLVTEFQTVSWSTKGYPYFAELSPEKQKKLEARDKKIVKDWAEYWVRQPGAPIIRVGLTEGHYEKSLPSTNGRWASSSWMVPALGLSLSAPFDDSPWALRIKTLYKYGAEIEIQENFVSGNPWTDNLPRLFDKDKNYNRNHPMPDLIFPNYQDYGYGIFLLDEKSRAYVLENIQNEKDAFLRSMMWGTLWDSVREAEMNPEDYVRLAIKNISVEQDELTIQTILSRVSTAMNYYLSDAQRQELTPRVESLLLGGMLRAKTTGQKVTFFRAYLNLASTEDAQRMLKKILKSDRQPVKMETTAAVAGEMPQLELPPLKTKDKFDILTRLIILEDRQRYLGSDEAEQMLAALEKTETSDDAKRYAYAARAGIGKPENKAKFWNDFVNNREISESWIEAAFVPFNSVRHSELTLPYLEKALAELPNLKRTRKIFFVNGWLAAFIGGQKDEKALAIVNKFLADNPNLDRDLRLKILENADTLERAVRIRAKYGK